MSAELPLAGGRITAGVVRVGDEVRRPVGPHSTYARAVLVALEDAGLSRASVSGPRQAGARAALLHPRLGRARPRARRLVRRAARRRRHARPPLPRRARRNSARAWPGNGLPQPCNTVHENGLPVAFIDWDGAAPGPRVLDLAHSVWRWAIISDTGELALDEQARRARLMCDAYGDINAAALPNAIAANQERVIARARERGDQVSEHWHRGERDWFAAHRCTFERALS